MEVLEERDGLSRLVPLEVTHHVPARGGLDLQGLGERLLYAVLADVLDAESNDRLDLFHAPGLCDGDQPHARRVAPRAGAGVRDALADALEVRAYLLHVCHNQEAIVGGDVRRVKNQATL